MTIHDSGNMMLDNNGSISLPLAPDEERRIIEQLSRKSDESPKNEGDLFYVLSYRWFMQWQKYVEQEMGYLSIDKHSSDSQSSLSTNVASRPGPIDNTDILIDGGRCEDNDPQLPRTLVEERDYILVSREVWEKLYEWYKGGPAVSRKLISQGIQETFVVEVFPLSLNLIDSRDKSQTTLRLSKKASIHELYEKVSILKGIETDKIRIWDYFNHSRQAVLTHDSNQTLEESNLQMDQHILLDVLDNGVRSSEVGMDSTGTELALVPMEPLRSSRTIAGGPSFANGYSIDSDSSLYPGSRSTLTTVQSTNMDNGYDTLRNSSKGDKGGLAGLQNLGNTCFMNSALQCLVHTPPLVDYFLQDYSLEINKQNPLGMHGELAIAFGDLLRKLWSSGQTSVAPRVFKGKLSRFAPQFSGYNQHDSQELLAFLLDGLHEDLNRVKSKPYFEVKDFDGRPDEEVADEHWNYHKARNDSVVVDVCQGQYKSTLVCPVCNKISITFDPFMYLSLPLPSTATRSMTVTVFYCDGSSLPMPFTVNVPRHGCCKDLCQALSAACCLESDEILILAEVYTHRIYRYLDNAGPLPNIKDDDYIVAYRLSKRQAELPRLEICHRYVKRSSLDITKPAERDRFLTPLVTYLEDTQTGADIERAVCRVLSPLKRKPFLNVDGPMENGSASKSNMDYSNNGLGESFTNQLEDNLDFENEPPKDLSFRFGTTDEKGLTYSPMMKNTPLKPSKAVYVLLDWTDDELEFYDSNYLKDLPVVYKPGLTVKKTKQEALSLFSCLDAFLKEEPLGPDDMWYCPRCKEHRQASKKLDLWRLPDIIVFHLKRFSYSRFWKNKLDTFVNFPIHNLDLSKYVKCNDASSGSHVYELYAISNHYGGLGGGHYTAYAKLIDDDRWYHFDDSHVSPVSEDDIRTPAAYLLFYQRVKVENNAVGDTSGS